MLERKQYTPTMNELTFRLALKLKTLQQSHALTHTLSHTHTHMPTLSKETQMTVIGTGKQIIYRDKPRKGFYQFAECSGET